MNYILFYILIVLSISYVTKGFPKGVTEMSNQKPVEVSVSILSGTTTNTTVNADFKCQPSFGLFVKNITGAFNLSQTFIPCTGLKSLIQKYIFNVSTSTGKRQTLIVKDLKTVSLYVGGEQIATQSGPIEGNTCRSGKVVLTHWFRNKEPMSCSSLKGLTHIESPTSTLRITGGNCEVFCMGKFELDYNPGLKNSRLPGLPTKAPKPLTLRPFRPLNSIQFG